MLFEQTDEAQFMLASRHAYYLYSHDALRHTVTHVLAPMWKGSHDIVKLDWLAEIAIGSKRPISAWTSGLWLVESRECSRSLIGAVTGDCL